MRVSDQTYTWCKAAKMLRLRVQLWVDSVRCNSQTCVVLCGAVHTQRMCIGSRLVASDWACGRQLSGLCASRQNTQHVGIRLCNVNMHLGWAKCIKWCKRQQEASKVLNQKPSKRAACIAHDWWLRAVTIVGSFLNCVTATIMLSWRLDKWPNKGLMGS